MIAQLRELLGVKNERSSNPSLEQAVPGIDFDVLRREITTSARNETEQREKRPPVLPHLRETALSDISPKPTSIISLAHNMDAERVQPSKIRAAIRSARIQGSANENMSNFTAVVHLRDLNSSCNCTGW